MRQATCVPLSALSGVTAMPDNEALDYIKCFLVLERQGQSQSQLATGLLPVIYVQWQVGGGSRAEPGLARLP